MTERHAGHAAKRNRVFLEGKQILVIIDLYQYSAPLNSASLHHNLDKERWRYRSISQ